MSKYSLLDLLKEDIAKSYDVYVDMDGVLTDFERRFEQFAGVTPDEFIAQKTIEFGKDKANKPTILTSPSREESSRIGKGVWIKRNMSGTPYKFGYKASGKAKYAAPNAILIDDRSDNIQAWKSAGGIGILYKSTDQVINELSKLGL